MHICVFQPQALKALSALTILPQDYRVFLLVGSIYQVMGAARVAGANRLIRYRRQ